MMMASGLALVYKRANSARHQLHILLFDIFAV